MIEDTNTKGTNAWVICLCGKKHQLMPGIDAPVYWCRNELMKLKVGDDIEYIEDARDIY